MGIPDTQRSAWQDLQKFLSEKQKTVYSEIRREPGTSYEIALRLGWPINRVSGRITELAAAGTGKSKLPTELRVIEVARRQNPDSGKMGIVWGVPDYLVTKVQGEFPGVGSCTI